MVKAITYKCTIHNIIGIHEYMNTVGTRHIIYNGRQAPKDYRKKMFVRLYRYHTVLYTIYYYVQE